MSTLIEMKNIKKLYHTGGHNVAALDGIDLKINEGEAVAIIGQSGSGKSTLMNIMGFLDSATSGEYFLDGVSVGSRKEGRLHSLRRDNIGFIFQNYNLIPALTALENTELPLIYRNIPAAERKKRAIQALEAVGLADRISHRPGQLSGGQQQRVAIARAIAARPRIVLADEPSGNLDPESAEQITSLLRSLAPAHTVIMITHDTKAAELMSRRVCISGGQIVEKTIDKGGNI